MGEKITRREVLKLGFRGATGLAVLPVVVAACQSATPKPAPTFVRTAPPTAAPAPTPASYLARQLRGTLRVGSGYTDSTTKAGMAAVSAAFAAATGVTPTVGPIIQGVFANAVAAYLSDSPGDVWTWFTGYRMRYYAKTGVAVPIDDVLANVSSNFSPAAVSAVTGDDGHIYAIPINAYPFAVFYRKSVWAARGYSVPATLAELKTLCKKMQKDGLIPFAFGDKDGWPAIGTFDILNLRLNGYQFHVDLLAGREKWTDARVAAVFEAWRELMPYHQAGAKDRIWQDAVATLIQKQAGMYYFGLFVSDLFTEAGAEAIGDLDFFTFPLAGNQFDAEAAIEAPMDALMLLAKSPTLAADGDNARAYLEFWAKGTTQLLMYESDKGRLPVALDADVSGLDALSRKAVEAIRTAKRITSFFDRDTRSDFAGPQGMQNFLLNFVNDPSDDPAPLQAQIQAFWDSLAPLGSSSSSVSPLARSA